MFSAFQHGPGFSGPSHAPQSPSTAWAFLAEYAQAIRGCDGEAICQLLRTGDAWSLSNQDLLGAIKTVPEQQFSRNMKQQVKDNALQSLLLTYVTFLRHWTAGVTDQTTFDNTVKVVGVLTTCFSSSERYWLSETVKRWTSYMVRLARQVDYASVNPTKHACVNQAAQLVARLFNMALNDRAPLPESRAVAMFHLVNLNLRIYFWLRTTRLCHSMLSHVNRSGLDLTLFPKSEQVTYRYFAGRSFLFQHRIHDAERELARALAECTLQPSAFRNRRTIFFHLVIARVILGKAPHPALLEKYGYQELFGPVITAIRQGWIWKFEQHCEQIQDALLPTASYLLLRERCQVLLYRNLFRRVFLITRPQVSQKVSFVKLEDMLHAARLSTQDADLDLDDVECLLASMISQGYVRGNINLQRKLVVLSKRDPFPPPHTLNK
ncbi:hypothetical protein IWQ62_003210 [Dispira parvispora]|uniref:PCI domain-containing protein n=1 Tax=Dispira parvispora TaxID=1520584 RepID=A0A9W8AU73_9FUNG|nr:hypothetical protein IWQ62_003210 [Dispira parvispora]